LRKGKVQSLAIFEPATGNVGSSVRREDENSLRRYSVR
jgi:hypothetical protein